MAGQGGWDAAKGGEGGMKDAPKRGLQVAKGGEGEEAWQGREARARKGSKGKEEELDTRQARQTKGWAGTRFTFVRKNVFVLVPVQTGGIPPHEPSKEKC